MTITEKAAYLRGLIEGRELDPEAGEGKLWYVLSELVGDMAAELTKLRGDSDALADSLENVEVGLNYLEELFQEDYDDFEDYDGDDEDDGYYPFSGDFRKDSLRVIDDDDEDGEDADNAGDGDDPEDTGVYYEVECPNCGEEISFDDETLDEGSIQCPSCGATLEFDMKGPEENGAPEQEAEPEHGENG